MFERGGRLLPSAWRVPFNYVPDTVYTWWPRQKAAKKVKDGPLTLAHKRALVAAPVWIISLFWVWTWWFAAGRDVLPWLYIPLSGALFYQFALLPSAFLFFVLKAKNPPNRKPLSQKKVAVITPCVPSQESIDIIERQLKAMSEITYPHDSWILDESNSKEIKKLARKYRVNHFSRKGIGKYNQEGYPFKTKTKAGNVNAWMDRVKRRKYDYFIQLDIDHAPKPNYLDKTLGHFRDPKVGWVQSPSVYSNTDNWISRGAAEQEFAYHGPIQMGYYGLSQTPMIVGSHCAYRTSAVKEIGGFQPTRAEDHLDTVAMVSKGYKGVFVPEIIAEGKGPETFGDYLTQQFAWAYSMFQVVMKHSFKHLIRIRSPKKLAPILFCETFYPLWALSYAITFFAPLVALGINHDIVKAKWSDFIVRIVPAAMAVLLVWFSGRPITHSKGIRISWRSALLEIVRWPTLLLAIINALLNVKKPYMVTPKGQEIKDAPAAKVYLPFVLLGLISSSVVLVASAIYGRHSTSGLTVFALLNTALMAAICLLDLNVNLRLITKGIHDLSINWLKPLATLVVLLVVFSMSIITSPMVQRSMVLAFSKPSPPIPAIDPSIAPPNELTDQQLLQQISTFRRPADSAAPTLGIYDPVHSFTSSSGYIRQSFIDWRQPRQMSEEILKSERLGAVPLITIEPAGYQNGHDLLKDISDGKFDNRLSKINQILNHVNQPVYVRFAHEMDLTGAFPWSVQDPKLYVAAYQHVVDLNRLSRNPNVKWVWSPGGVQGTAEAYYPGDQYVDIIGTTVLYDRYWSGDFRPTFAQLVNVRVWLESYHKPVWMTEFGAGNADPNFQAQLVDSAISQFQAYGFSALVYINIDDPHLKIPNYTFADTQSLGGILGLNLKAPHTSLVDSQQTVKISTAKSANQARRDVTSSQTRQNTNVIKDLTLSL